MKNPFLATILVASVVGLAACSGPEVQEDVVTIPVEYSTNVSPAEEAQAEVAPAPRSAASDVKRINAGEFLQTLVEAGCQPKEAKYREVEGAALEGGHVHITCRETGDPLDLESPLE